MVFDEESERKLEKHRHVQKKQLANMFMFIAITSEKTALCFYFVISSTENFKNIYKLS